MADAVRERVAVREIEQIWLFPPVRADEREWGTAVIARRVAAGRLGIFTAGYVLVVRGRDRGQGRVQVDDVGESPDAVVPEVLRGVQDRAGEAEPPVEIAPALWFPADDPEDDLDDEPPATG